MTIPSDDKVDKALNGEETADSEHTTNEGSAEEETGVNSCYYDKTKSFFDNLSCGDSRYIPLLIFSLLCFVKCLGLWLYRAVAYSSIGCKSYKP